jgi:hypothetical protein
MGILRNCLSTPFNLIMRGQVVELFSSLAHKSGEKKDSREKTEAICSPF